MFSLSPLLHSVYATLLYVHHVPETCRGKCFFGHARRPFLCSITRRSLRSDRRQGLVVFSELWRTSKLIHHMVADNLIELVASDHGEVLYRPHVQRENGERELLQDQIRDSFQQCLSGQGDPIDTIIWKAQQVATETVVRSTSEGVAGVFAHARLVGSESSENTVSRHNTPNTMLSIQSECGTLSVVRFLLCGKTVAQLHTCGS